MSYIIRIALIRLRIFYYCAIVTKRSSLGENMKIAKFSMMLAAVALSGCIYLPAEEEEPAPAAVKPAPAAKPVTTPAQNPAAQHEFFNNLEDDNDGGGWG